MSSAIRSTFSTALLVILLTAAAAIFSQVPDANAESYGDKTCSTLPKTCQWNYSGGSYHYYKLDRSGCGNCSGSWATQFETARAAWQAAYGPQLMTTGTPPGGYNYTTVFFKEWPTYTLPISTLVGPAKGVTANYDWDTGFLCAQRITLATVACIGLRYISTQLN